jgi:hypothetical protein
MLIVPASNVSVPFTVVIRTLSNVALSVLLPAEKNPTAALVKAPVEEKTHRALLVLCRAIVEIPV